MQPLSPVFRAVECPCTVSLSLLVSIDLCSGDRIPNLIDFHKSEWFGSPARWPAVQHTLALFRLLIPYRRWTLADFSFVVRVPGSKRGLALYRGYPAGSESGFQKICIYTSLSREKSIFVAKVFAAVGLSEDDNTSGIESPSFSGGSCGNTEALVEC
jgi:hypothetical protein